MPSPPQPGECVQLSDWPADVIDGEMVAKEDQWAKVGHKFTLPPPKPEDYYGRYIKYNKQGDAVFKNPSKPFTAEDLEPRPKRRGPPKEKKPQKPAAVGVRSSTRLQQQAQVPLDLSEGDTPQPSSSQLMPPPPAPLPAESESASNANVASADTETASTQPVVDSKAESATAPKATVINKASAVSATKAAAPTKTKSAVKPTAAGKTAASSKSGAKKRVTVTVKVKIEGAPEPMATQGALPKTSSATANGSKKAVQGAVGSKRKAAKDLSAAPVKRPRIGRACNPCREKKTRCDGHTPCEACEKRGFNCVYEDVHSKPDDGAQGPDNRPPGGDGPPEKTGQDKKQPSGSMSNAKRPNASSTSSKTQDTKRKREDEAADEDAQSHPTKKNKTSKTILPNPAKLRAQQKLDDEINKFVQENSPAAGPSTQKRKRLPSEEEAETRPAKLQRHTTYAFEVLEGAKLEAMQPRILESLAQSASDFKPLQKIGHFVKCGKLAPQIVDIKPQEEAFHNRPSIKLVIPDHIKGFLVDDWENVTKNNQLVHLPHPKPVEVILQDYLAAERPNREEGSTQLDVLEETIAGLREYFDRALGRILLYRYVRAWLSRPAGPRMGPVTDLWL